MPARRSSIRVETATRASVAAATRSCHSQLKTRRRASVIRLGFIIRAGASTPVPFHRLARRDKARIPRVSTRYADTFTSIPDPPADHPDFPSKPAGSYGPLFLESFSSFQARGFHERERIAFRRICGRENGFLFFMKEDDGNALNVLIC